MNDQGLVNEVMRDRTPLAQQVERNENGLSCELLITHRGMLMEVTEWSKTILLMHQHHVKDNINMLSQLILCFMFG